MIDRCIAGVDVDARAVGVAAPAARRGAPGRCASATRSGSTGPARCRRCSSARTAASTRWSAIRRTSGRSALGAHKAAAARLRELRRRRRPLRLLRRAGAPARAARRTVLPDHAEQVADRGVRPARCARSSPRRAASRASSTCRARRCSRTPTRSRASCGGRWARRAGRRSARRASRPSVSVADRARDAGTPHARARWRAEPWHIDAPAERALIDRLERALAAARRGRSAAGRRAAWSPAATARS